MAEDKEQLKIEATLDTSKLKQDAKNGLAAVSNEIKKVSADADNASKSVNAIGTSAKNVSSAMSSAGSQATSALRTVSNEARNATSQMDNLAKSVRKISLQQGLGIANQAVNQFAPVGQAIGSSMGMSESQISTTGGLISGAMAGAMAGSAAGPWGAVIGGLVGAGASLIQAGDSLKEAGDRLKGVRERIADRQEREAFEKELSGANDVDTLQKMLERERGNVRTIDREIYNASQFADVHVSSDDKGRAEEEKKSAEELARLEDKREAALRRQSAIQAEITRRKTEEARLEKALANMAEREAENELRQSQESQRKQREFQRQINENDAAEQRKNEIKSISGKIESGDLGGARADIEAGLAKYRNLLATADKVMRNTENPLETRQDAQKTVAAYQSQIDALEGAARKLEEAFTKLGSKAAGDIGKSSESLLGGLGGTKLTDSLTRIGGGTGYGVQMSGISGRVTDISNNVKSILKELQNRYSQTNASAATF